tara:strand:- start:3645 stop:3776 length:132 start_codon:yes stop_codon:yes gene_type:complete
MYKLEEIVLDFMESMLERIEEFMPIIIVGAYFYLVIILLRAWL